MSLGVIVSAVFVIAAQAVWELSPWQTLGWTAWTVLLAAYLGYDLPSWSPLWRADVKELVTGRKHTRVEVTAERCIGCGMCATVCPTDVFELDAGARKAMVVRLDACQACGACIENCPTHAIEDNFRAGVCSCPTCAVINATKSARSHVHDTGKPSGDVPAEPQTSSEHVTVKTE